MALFRSSCYTKVDKSFYLQFAPVWQVLFEIPALLITDCHTINKGITSLGTRKADSEWKEKRTSCRMAGYFWGNSYCWCQRWDGEGRRLMKLHLCFTSFFCKYFINYKYFTNIVSGCICSKHLQQDTNFRTWCNLGNLTVWIKYPWILQTQWFWCLVICHMSENPCREWLFFIYPPR